jgi:hypothetical protein
MSSTTPASVEELLAWAEADRPRVQYLLAPPDVDGPAIPRGAQSVRGCPWCVRQLHDCADVDALARTVHLLLGEGAAPEAADPAGGQTRIWALTERVLAPLTHVP